MSAAFSSVFVGTLDTTSEAENRTETRAPVELDTSLLDHVCGGLSAPAGGTIKESSSNYTWMGMNYTQTHRTAYDADGNVVGTETHRPGSVWSDTTETNQNGTRTTYDVGGSGLAAQISTQHDTDGNLRGVGADARLNVSVGDVNINGNLRGNLALDRDQNGQLTGYDARAHADVGLVHEPTGLGVRVGADGNVGSSIQRDSEGNITGFRSEAGFSVPADITHNGERLVGMNLVGGNATIQGQRNEDGTWDGRIAADATLRGQSIGGELHGQGLGGDNVDLGGSAFYQRQVLGPYGASARVEAGVDAHLGDNPSIRAWGDGQASLFGQPLVRGSGEVGIDQNGPYARGEEQHVALPGMPTIPDVNLPPISMPPLPNIPLPEVRLPDHLPEFRTNETGLPGNREALPSAGVENNVGDQSGFSVSPATMEAIGSNDTTFQPAAAQVEAPVEAAPVEAAPVEAAPVETPPDPPQEEPQAAE